MSGRSLLAICFFALAACSDSGGTDTPDGPGMDAQTSKVMEVTCPATPAETITTQALSFDKPMVTVSRGAIVKLVSTSLDHPIEPLPGTPDTDPGIVVTPGTTKCLRFAVAGTFKFWCRTHGYPGTVVVN